jgi:integrase
MSKTGQAEGHLQVKPDSNGRTRSYYAYWSARSKKRGRRLGPAHVRDTGRRTPRGAVIWRAGDGPRPTPEHLTPKDAEARLAEILEAAEAPAEASTAKKPTGSLRQALEGWLAKRRREKDLKRSTVEDYEEMFERLHRDLGAETPVDELTDERLESYFADFKAERVLPRVAAQKALAEGLDVREVKIQRWTARAPGNEPVEVYTRGEAVQLAAAVGGTWKHCRQGTYRVLAPGVHRTRRVSWSTAQTLDSEGWSVHRRTTKRWVLRKPAAPQTRNKYRDILAAALGYAVIQGWIERNPLAGVSRTNTKRVRERILRRDDFYDPEEVARILEHAPGVLEEAFWLCGAHAGFRLPGEAQGTRWGAVDFKAGVIRPYDNWVRNAPDDTKTSDSVAVPMTPRLTRALAELKLRGWATADDDFVFTHDRRGRPVCEKQMRATFKLARVAAGLKPIRMYNLRHSFGTSLARGGVDIRTIQALMRHDRLTTTEQYLAYAPQPDLAARLTRALDPPGLDQVGSRSSTGIEQGQASAEATTEERLMAA